MAEKIIVLFIIYSAVLSYDVSKLKTTDTRERIVYVAIMLCTFYLSIIYVAMHNWPNLTHLVKFIVENPAQMIIDSIKVSS